MTVPLDDEYVSEPDAFESIESAEETSSEMKAILFEDVGASDGADDSALIEAVYQLHDDLVTLHNDIVTVTGYAEYLTGYALFGVIVALSVLVYKFLRIFF